MIALSGITMERKASSMRMKLRASTSTMATGSQTLKKER